MKQIPEDMWDEELLLLTLAYRSSVQERSTPRDTYGDYVAHLQEQLEAV